MTEPMTLEQVRELLVAQQRERHRVANGCTTWEGRDAAVREASQYGHAIDAIDAAIKARDAAVPVAWRADWPNWRQYHDADDNPLPESWDSPPSTITPLYTAPPAQPASVPEDVRDGINGPHNACCYREHCRAMLAAIDAARAAKGGE